MDYLDDLFGLLKGANDLTSTVKNFPRVVKLCKAAAKAFQVWRRWRR